MNYINPNSKPEKQKEQKEFIGKTREILINKVRIILQDYVDTEALFTLNDIIKLEKEDPDAIVDIKPTLYKRFIKKDNTINTFVKPGNTVIIKQPIEKEKGKTYLVLNIRFKKLNNMTVIVADLVEAITQEKTFEITYNLTIKK